MGRWHRGRGRHMLTNHFRAIAMKLFFCNQCSHPVHFENTTCLNCGATLAFLPRHGRIAALAPTEEGDWALIPSSGDTAVDHADAAAGEPAPRYRLCDHYTSNSLCNWAIDADDSASLCESCRMSRVIPDLSRPGRAALLYQMETGKRRLLFNLMGMGLPVLKDETALPLTFSFLEDPDDPTQPKVITGHDSGHITINLNEADDLHRHRSQEEMGESYRTVLGHFRHEIGHYYWDLLIAPTDPNPEADAQDHATPETMSDGTQAATEPGAEEPSPSPLAEGARQPHQTMTDGLALIERFRTIFGDEREDYCQALKRHYENPRQDWAESFISKYASSHPWEDWAETWAHYMHMYALLETSDDLAAHLPRVVAIDTPPPIAMPRPRDGSFDELIKRWTAVSFSMNALSRSLGHPDPYPFAIPPAALEKMRFVHEVITTHQISRPGWA